MTTGQIKWFSFTGMPMIDGIYPKDGSFIFVTGLEYDDTTGEVEDEEPWYDIVRWRENHWATEGGIICDHATHWMPIPELTLQERGVWMDDGRMIFGFPTQ